jgi:hypothetical protein
MVRVFVSAWRLLPGIVAGCAFFSTAFGQLSNGSGQQVSLGWNASPDPTVVGYYVYYGNASGIYPNKINAGTNLSFTVTGLVAGTTNYFTATSYDASGEESSYVPEISYIVPGILTMAANPINNFMQIQFPVASSHFYDVQESSDLKSWTTVWVTPVETNNMWIEYDEPNTNAAMYYRLILN